MEIVHRGDVVFVPGDPPRAGQFALLNPSPGRSPGRISDIELVVPTASMTRRRLVVARFIPVANAVGWLASLPADANGSASMTAWSAAVKAGVALVARGRLLPSISDGGFDAWQVGPLDRTDEDLLGRLAAAFPAEAHAIPIAGSRPLRVRSPESLIRDCWDAVADALVRSPGAARATQGSAFAGSRSVRVEPMRDWLAASTQSLHEGGRAGVRLEPPPGPEEQFSAVLQVRSHADPSLVVDAVDLWRAPDAVLRRFGDAVETELLLSLRRGSRVWPAMSRLLDQARPDRLVLDEAETAELLGPAAEALESAGLEVLWPAELTSDLELRVVVGTPTPPKAGRTVFGLDQLLDFRWEVSIGGVVLTQDEVEALAEAKRPLIRLRGRWVAVDAELLERLRRRRPGRMRAGEALAAALGGGELEVDGEMVAARVEGPLAELVAHLHEVDAVRQMAEPPGLRAELRPYQRRGLAWLVAMCELGLGGCLADDMGLGKTVQVIALHLQRGAGPTLVVCPASLLGNWERELRRFAPELPVRRYHGGGRHLDDIAEDEVVLVTYGVVRRDRADLALPPWGLVVADEAQYVKNPLSRSARELRHIPSAVRVALTGTPVENRLSDLWSILDWTAPGLLGSLPAFRREVAIPIERYGDSAVRDRLARVVRPFLLRRRKIDPEVAPELPPKTEMDRVVPLTSEQATLYEAVVREALDEIQTSEGMARRGLVLKLLTALKQICNHPAQYLKQRHPLAGRSGKLAALEELLEIIVDAGDSALVFTQYVAMGRLLEAHLRGLGIPTLFLHGGIPPRRRDDMVEAFQAGDAPVFLLSLKAGGVGLNLTRATHVLHYDRWWNPAVEDQATDRAYRIGQDRPVQVHRLVTEGTIEDRIAALLRSKRELAEAVVGAGEAWISELSNAELAELVSLRATS
ncbi:MAG: DEAD/DEAH box helicase [Candidatus Dormibacteria bacterium]